MRTLVLTLLLSLPASAAKTPAGPADGYIGMWTGEARLESGQKYEVSVSIRKHSRGFSASYRAWPKGKSGGRLSGTAEALEKGSRDYSVRLRLDAFRNFNMPATASVEEGGRLNIRSVMFSGYGDLDGDKDRIRFVYDSRMGAGSGVLTKKNPRKPGAARKKKPSSAKAPVKFEMDLSRPD